MRFSKARVLLFAQRTVGLISLTIIILLAAELLGLIPSSLANGFNHDNGFLNWLQNNLLLLSLLFFSLLGLLAYRHLGSSAYSELDPSAVIPDRVKSAFDALTEGVLILDKHEKVVLANSTFERVTGIPLNKTVGYGVSRMAWSNSITKGHSTFESYNSDDESALPWQLVIKDGRSRTGMRILLNQDTEFERVFMVNCTPITDGQGDNRGVLATFDDVSELEEKNKELRSMLGKLEISQRKVEAQNKKLHLLATLDPLTNCLNRRSFYATFDHYFSNARADRRQLSAVMVDLDHFKAINDGFGHSAGDEVIKVLAKVLQANSRDSDLVTRYGGEEFAVVLVDMDLQAAKRVADRILQALKDSDAAKFTNGQVVTASLGVSTLANGAEDKEALLDQADQALYVAKQSGRNRVVCWSNDIQSQPIEEPAPSTTEEPAATAVPKTAQAKDAASLIELEAQHNELESLRNQVNELEQLAAERQDELEALLQYDALTGLQQRDPFHTRISLAIARGYRDESLTAVVSLAVTSFRRVNDTLGHHAASLLLQEITRRLESILRSADSLVSAEGGNSFKEVSRLCSDEFGLLVSDLNDMDAVNAAIGRIIKAVTETVDVQGVTIKPSCVLGISLFPNDGEYAEQLTHNAALARQQAQRDGREYAYFTADMPQTAAQLLQEAS